MAAHWWWLCFYLSLVLFVPWCESVCKGMLGREAFLSFYKVGHEYIKLLFSSTVYIYQHAR